MGELVMMFSMLRSFSAQRQAGVYGVILYPQASQNVALSDFTASMHRDLGLHFNHF